MEIIQKDPHITFLPNEEAFCLMDEARDIRNVQLFGHLDAGCSTIIDSIASNPLKFLPETNHFGRHCQCKYTN